MLKGFLLANITDEQKKNSRANALEATDPAVAGCQGNGTRLLQGLATQPVCRQDPRAPKKGAKPEDFERIGTEFHRWVRDHATIVTTIALRCGTEDFFDFIYGTSTSIRRQYLRLMEASRRLVPGLEPVLYNARWDSHCNTCSCLLRCDRTTPTRSRRRKPARCHVLRHALNVARLELPQHRVLHHALRHVCRHARDSGPCPRGASSEAS